jgi:hypothetical protein
MQRHAYPAIIASEPRHYERFGLDPQQIKPWEDGQRTDGRAGTYEWWYFDAHLDDGTKLVIVFYTKPMTAPDKPLTPLITVDLDLADGRNVRLERTWSPDAFAASQERCDVRIGANRFQGDLHAYTIHVALEGFSADVTLTGTVPSWRPATGHMLFGAHEEHLFAWLPAVPEGTVEATITVDGATRMRRGNGYHDHNWGNVSMLKLMNNWYWARGTIGSYAIISSYITAEKEYGYATLPIFMLAKDGVISADASDKVSFRASDITTDVYTGKPVGSTIVYDYRDGKRRYVVIFTRQEDLVREKFIDRISGLKHLLARLTGFDGAYLRFAGELRLEHYLDDQLMETQHGEAIWELMYFGKVHGA